MEVLRGPVPGRTCQHGVLEARRLPSLLVRTEAAVVFHMGCPVLVLREVELSRHLPVGSGHAVALVVEIDEGEGAAPAVGLEHLHGCRHRRSLVDVIVETVT